MQSIFVNANAQIIKGVCKGIQGRVVGADAIRGIVTIEPEPGTTIKTKRENIYQDKDGMVLSLDNDGDAFGTYHGGSL